jgi:uncharacterized membrane protein
LLPASFTLWPLAVTRRSCQIIFPPIAIWFSSAEQQKSPAASAFPPIQRSAAWGLIALLIAVMPANINMAAHHADFPSIPAWALWARLPLQIPLIYWAWIYARRLPRGE